MVGARLDASRRTVVPVTANYWLAVWDHPDSVEVGVKTSATHRERLVRGNRARQCWFICQMEALQREACARDTYWQQQRKREDGFLSDLDSAVVQSLFRVSESNLYQVLDDWMNANFHPPSLVMHLWPLPPFCMFQASASCLAPQRSGRQLREAALEQQDAAQAEAQGRATRRGRLALVLPLRVLHVLTLGKRRSGGHCAHNPRENCQRCASCARR